MTYSTLVATDKLEAHLEDPSWVIFDCRFHLANPVKGKNDYQEAHIPKAIYVSLEDDLSIPKTVTSGRHPLPVPEFFVEKLEAWGVSRKKQIVVYDDMGGAIAGRMWWMLRWVGHETVAVLDGGLAKWKQENREITDQVIKPIPSKFKMDLHNDFAVSTQNLVLDLEEKQFQIIDARGESRYLGEEEPIDAVAGHIPRAKNRPFKGNLKEDGTFLSSEELKQRFLPILEGGISPKQVVHSCGSGVTACHNLLAMEIAGLSGAKLYPGSWSEWATNPGRPVAKGNE